MSKFLGILMVAGLAFYALACLGLFLGQRSFIYYPPPAAAFPAPVTTSLAVPGAVLRISERPLASRRALYLLHYRGYAGSTGTPSEQALVDDAVLLFDRVAASHPEVEVVGRSLGTGVAVQLASRRPVKKLVLVTPFDSIVDLAVQQFPVFPVRWLLQDRYESGRYAQQLKDPTLVLVAERDEIIPAWSTQRLLSRFAPGVATEKVIPEAGHNTISESPAYVPALRGF